MSRALLLSSALLASLAAGGVFLTGPDVATLFAQGEVSEIKVGDYVQVKTRTGADFGGQVLAVAERSIRIKTRFGVQTINTDDITSWERQKSNAELYREQADQCKTAGDWCDLAEWAFGVNESDLANEALDKAVEVDPESSRARDLRGEVKHDGKWMPLDKAMEAQGKVKFRGAWVTPDERDALIAKEDQAAKDQKLKGLHDLEAEYIGRPWAEITPIESENYEVWCNSTEEVAREYAQLMEALFQEYEGIFKKQFFPRRRKGLSRVYIHRCHQQFMDWTGVGPNIGGFYRPWLHDVTAYHGSFGVTGSTEEVLAHEGTHQFQGIIFKDLSNCPVWIIEGMAVYFGDGTEIKGRRVKINVIPRDRLVGLKRAIRNNTYVPIKQLLRLGRSRFNGFHYGHGWGVIYWCLYGQKMGAKHCKNGRKIMEDYLLRCASADKFLDANGYENEAKYFENLITEQTGLSVEDWEKEYKEWILELPLPDLGKRKSGGRWVSEKLLIEVAKPGGWRWLDFEDLNANAQEVVAVEKPGKSVQRISTHCLPNYAKGELSAEIARKFLEGNFVGITYQEEPVQAEVKGYPAVTATFRASRRVRRESGVEAADGDDSGREERVYQVVMYSDTDKIRANMLECDADTFEGNQKVFDQYLEKFKITY